MIRLDYDDDELAAVLSAEGTAQTLGRIQLAFHDAGVEYSFSDNNTLVTPWWSFLAIAPRVGDIIDGCGDELAISTSAERLLGALTAQRARFRDAAMVPRDASQDLQGCLRSIGFTRALTAKQLSNVLHLLSLPSAADFSVPGAGKTTEALAWYAIRRRDTQGARLIVVCPKNAFLAWEDQIEECLPGLSTMVATRLVGEDHQIESLLEDPARNVFLVTYQRFARAETKRLIIKALYAQHGVYVVLDESHRIKRGQAGQWGAAALSIAHMPAGKLILSGTPVPNDVADLVPQLRFLAPHERVTEGNVAEKIQPLYVRTTKADLQLPPIRRRTLQIPLGPAHRKLYDLLKSEAQRQLEGLPRGALNRYREISRCVVKLLQAASNPALLAADLETLHGELFASLSSEGLGKKVDVACDLARRLAAKRKKVVIWTSFVTNVEAVARRLSDLGADYIHGGVGVGSEEEEDTREAKIKRFHDDPRAMVLVANPAAAGESISLHRVCHHAIYIDRSFNAAHYLQSEDRIYRYGLKPNENTFVFLLEARDTIDQVVSTRLAGKVAVMANILRDPTIRVDSPLNLDTDAAEEGLDNDDIDALMHYLHVQSDGA